MRVTLFLCACLTALLGSAAGAQAESPKDTRPWPLASTRWAVSLLDAGLQVESSALNDSALTPTEIGKLPPSQALATDAVKRKQVRYRTMVAVGYTLASLAFIATVATGAGQIYMRQEHRSGSYSCGPYLTPYFTLPGMAAGLAIGLRGTFAGRRLRVEHPGLAAPDNTRARRMSAVIGTVFAMGAAAFSVPGFFCNS